MTVRLLGPLQEFVKSIHGTADYRTLGMPDEEGVNRGVIFYS